MSRITRFMRLLQYLIQAYRLYNMCRGNGCAYGHLLNVYGIPEVAMFVGVGREAWRISCKAVEEKEAGK